MELISGEKPVPGSPQGHDRALSSTLASVESLSMPPVCILFSFSIETTVESVGFLAAILTETPFLPFFFG